MSILSDNPVSRFHLIVTLGILTLFLTAGCSVFMTPTPEPNPTVPVLQSAGPGGDAALLTAPVMVDGPCLYVGNAADRWVPLFKPGMASWENGALNVEGEVYEIGDRISFGGGEIEGFSNLEFIQQPDASCDTGKGWVVSTVGPRPNPVATPVTSGR